MSWGPPSSEELEAIVNGTGRPRDADNGWPPLRPLSGGERLPEFPVDALPAPLRSWVEAVACATQTPPALPAAMALAVASTATLGAAVVECAPGWDEELALYVAVVLPSGERKSTVVREARAPLEALERELMEEARPRVARAQAERETLEARRAQLVRDAAKGKGDADELADAAERLAAMGEPVEPRLFAGDATPEALAGLLAQHRRLGVLADESALLDNLAGRYSDGQANLHLACQAYSGEEVRIDRRGRAPEHLRRPLLALGLAVQPHVLEAIAGNATMREQGFLARLTFLLPESNLGHRELHPPPVPAAVTASYEQTIRSLAALRRADTTATTTPGTGSVGSVSASPGARLTLAAEATAALTELRAALEPRLDPEHGDLAAIGAWANRHPGRVARIAGLLHLLEADVREPIREATMRAAVRIGECLLAHVRRALLDRDPEHEQLKRAARWAAERGTFTLRDLERGPLNGRGSRDDADRLAHLLEEHGYARPLSAPARSSAEGRPPSPRYEVNPAAPEARR